MQSVNLTIFWHVDGAPLWVTKIVETQIFGADMKIDAKTDVQSVLKCIIAFYK